MVVLPSPAVVVLVGASASGKSTWAEGRFAPEEIVSSDRLRAVVGRGRRDIEASDDAFDLVDRVLTARCGRGLLTVVDSTGLDDTRRRAWLDMGRAAGLPVFAVPFHTDRRTCVARNRSRDDPVPVKVIDAQIKNVDRVVALLEDEGFTVSEPDADLHAVPPAFVAETAAAPDKTRPTGLAFALQLPDYGAIGTRHDLRDELAAVARAAERVGFESVWVMDHLVQIPFVGRPWLDMLDSYTTLAYLAGVTERIRLGTMVTGITFRNVAHLAKIIATLDVVSGGRAEAGIGAAWFAHEHKAYGYEFPPDRERLDLLEDALRLLPAMWGPGAKPFEGIRISLPETTCYPRPLQQRIPILVGGSGERRTLRLVAQYADACNLRGDLDHIVHAIGVLHRHCADVGRAADDVRITHLGTALTGQGPGDVRATVDALRGNRGAPEYAAAVNAATVDDHIERFRRFADVGVGLCVVSLPDVGVEAVERFGQVIDAFRPARRD